MASSNTPEGIRFLAELKARERARKAFATIDNDQVMRRALVHRTRPSRGNYQPGEWVMLWCRRGQADGFWRGPARVIVQEGNAVVWANWGTRLYRVAPEHVRPVSAMEERNLDRNQLGTPSTNLQGGTQYVDLVGNQNNQETSRSASASAQVIPSDPLAEIPRNPRPTTVVYPLALIHNSQMVNLQRMSPKAWIQFETLLLRWIPQCHDWMMIVMVCMSRKFPVFTPHLIKVGVLK